MVNEDVRDLLRMLPAVAVMENGRVAYVVTTFDYWKQSAQGAAVRVNNGRPGHLTVSPSRTAEQTQEAAVLERLNQEILSLREQIQMQEAEVTDDGA